MKQNPSSWAEACSDLVYPGSIFEIRIKGWLWPIPPLKNDLSLGRDDMSPHWRTFLSKTTLTTLRYHEPKTLPSTSHNFNIYTSQTASLSLGKSSSVWWYTQYTYPSERYQTIGMVIPNIWENKNVPNHQPVICVVGKLHSQLRGRPAPLWGIFWGINSYPKCSLLRPLPLFTTGQSFPVMLRGEVR